MVDVPERRTTPMINSDMGESLGLHSFGNDLALLDSVDAINVACGFHSGDPDTMAETVAAAHKKGVLIGAHPGLPDLVGFGRREMKLSPSEVESLILYQVGALPPSCDARALPSTTSSPTAPSTACWPGIRSS